MHPVHLLNALLAELTEFSEILSSPPVPSSAQFFLQGVQQP
jgi:hypothetical protein